MKKIGTITFHWATNFGAVLQAYALQRFLLNEGYDTEIINYLPRYSIIRQYIRWLKNRQFGEFLKEWHLKDFRKTHLLQSKITYHNNSELKKIANQYSVIITGSDQVWNRSFTLHGEGKPTLSYFLNFAGEKTKKVAYAVSFGANEITKQYYNCVEKEIKSFDNIGVREKTGEEIVKSFHVNSKVVCDPTILLNKSDYNSIAGPNLNPNKFIFMYMLHDYSCEEKLIRNTMNVTFNGYRILTANHITLQQWLKNIRDSSLVVTNSFHGTVLSIIFNVPFIVFPVRGSNMNNRIETLLDFVKLRSRIVKVYDERELQRICSSDIDWKIVNIALESMRNEGKLFIKSCLQE